ncbi:MAG: glycoside hydrolase family 9 protein [Akkermansiaceae bacterium]|nr:glycoside hydrolase family 9 protein [Armatimonadota bacterium]
MTIDRTTESDPRPFLYRYVPMPVDASRSLQHQWDTKPVLESLLVDDMDSLDNWGLKTVVGKKNVATISLSREHAVDGGTSLKFVSPTKLRVPLAGERYWEWQFLTRKFDKKDFSSYNRVSVQIFPDFPGHRKLHVLLILHNEGNVPDTYFREGIHAVMLENHRWNKVAMEIPHLPHDKVTGVSIVYRLQGNEPGASETITFYADKLRFERVKADHFEGWSTDNSIAFSHSGYNSDSKKTAFTSQSGADKFDLVNVATRKTVLTKAVSKETSTAGSFTVFDFSEVTAAGKYKLVYGKLETEPFPIEKYVWMPSIEKSVNLFFCERCGFAVPGLHDACHTDWYTMVGDAKVGLSGGWHDAGDLSQSHNNTAEATGILFRLANKYRAGDKKLSARLLDEGRWGLKWLHKNRFEGGKKVDWTVIDHWSDGKVGNFDDIVAPPPGGEAGYFSVIANVEAASALKEVDPALAKRCERFAVEDWNAQATGGRGENAERLANAVLAGARLFALTHDPAIKDQSIAYAEQLMALQRTEPMPWSIPLSGFFYQDADRVRLFGFNHGFTVASPITGLVELCKLFPDHTHHVRWVRSIRLHAEYLRTLSKLTAPYYMIPANVYKLGTVSDDVTSSVADSQIKQGIKMDEDHYLRMFPVWGPYRGNTPNVLSWGIGLASANQILRDPELKSIAQSQLEWVVGKNPFSQSQMYGEGYNFSPQYAVMTGDMVGGLTVGILTNGDRDVPYMQAPVFCNYKEVWGHCSIRWLQLLDCLD